MLPGTMNERDKYLTEGFAIFPRAQSQLSRTLRIQGIAEPDGIRTVQLDVGRRATATISGPLREQVGGRASPMLVDRGGNTYTAIGYIYEGAEGVEIRLDPARGITVGDVPPLPTAGNQKLRLLFRVTEDSTIVGFRLGDVAVASCNLRVEAKP